MQKRDIVAADVRPALRMLRLVKRRICLEPFGTDVAEPLDEIGSNLGKPDIREHHARRAVSHNLGACIARCRAPRNHHRNGDHASHEATKQAGDEIQSGLEHQHRPVARVRARGNVRRDGAGATIEVRIGQRVYFNAAVRQKHIGATVRLPGRAMAEHIDDRRHRPLQRRWIARHRILPADRGRCDFVGNVSGELVDAGVLENDVGFQLEPEPFFELRNQKHRHGRIQAKAGKRRVGRDPTCRHLQSCCDVVGAPRPDIGFGDPALSQHCSPAGALQLDSRRIPHR